MDNGGSAKFLSRNKTATSKDYPEAVNDDKAVIDEAEPEDSEEDLAEEYASKEPAERSLFIS